MRPVKEYLHTDEEDEIVPFSARISKKILDEAKAIAERERVPFAQVIRACLTHFVDEMKSKSGSKK